MALEIYIFVSQKAVRIIYQTLYSELWDYMFFELELINVFLEMCMKMIGKNWIKGTFFIKRRGFCFWIWMLDRLYDWLFFLSIQSMLVYHLHFSNKINFVFLIYQICFMAICWKNKDYMVLCRILKCSNVIHNCVFIFKTFGLYFYFSGLLHLFASSLIEKMCILGKVTK